MFFGLKKMVISLFLLLGVMSYAQENQSKEQYQQALQEASMRMYQAIQGGPTRIALQELAVLTLPLEYGFVPAKEARELLELFGHTHLDGVLGMVVPNPQHDAQSNWMVLISYTKSGHIMDDDAKEWKSEELLASLQEGTKESNKIRKERGFPELNILGWIEKPHYDEQTNRLIWSIKALQEGLSLEQATINYNTLALSKEGYISMNLATKLDQIAQHQSIPKTLLAFLSFNEGSRYSDFNANTDKIAEYGLAALITGVAAKKLGLFAVIAAFLLKFSKVIIAALAGFGFYAAKRKKAASKPKDNEDA